MKNLILFICLFVLSLPLLAQQKSPSKLILKNQDVITGQIIEIRVGEFVKIEIVGNNVLTIPYNEIAQINFDDQPRSTAESNRSIEGTKKKIKPLDKFYFETINEVSLGLGMGKVYGYGIELENFDAQIANRDSYFGFYTVNGLGYKNMLFAGIGIGILGHSGYSEDSNDFGYSMPFTLDLRYRPLKNKQFSPLLMASTGMSYYEGSMGTFTVLSGIGLSIRLQERFDAQLLLTHHYDRFSPQLSVENGILESYFSGAYVNYAGARLGISYRI